MIKEEGIVTSATKFIAWVRTTRKTACDTCEAKKNCQILSSKNSMHFKVRNTLNAAGGDHVIVGVHTKPLLLLTFLLYVFPIFLLLIGALAGKNIPLFAEIDPNLSSIFFGFLLFFLAVVIIKKINNRIAENWKYKPFLIRIVKNK